MTFFGFSEIPEEIRQKMREEHERRMMEVQDFQHAVRTLFSELPVEHMLILRQLLSHLGTDETGKLANYYEGTCVGFLQSRFDVCPGCGVNHEKEFMEELTKDDSEHEESIETEPTDEQKQYLAHAEEAAAIRRADKALEESVLMNEYNVISGIGKQVICKGCNSIYPSLKDRMMKDPDNCDGCRQKAKWG